MGIIDSVVNSLSILPVRSYGDWFLMYGDADKEWK